ncbi:hypothetical protein T459_30902 [Capsicum annuum]|uniref:EF-hand domain-containing protein n=1 Tax=Capsicum annuum TaxID=4072 RepID=A0A2G2Y9P7_CAPAN|nr:hypothetical protein T459_30902 [Capsicum annuum]
MSSMVFLNTKPRTIEKPTSEELKSIFKKYDKTGDGISLTSEELKSIFKKYGKTGDGKLSRQELKRDACLWFTGFRSGRALQRADRNSDVYISENEINELVNYASKMGYQVTT